MRAFLNKEGKGKETSVHNSVYIMTRLPYLSVRSGEFCVCKLLASTYAELISTILT